MDLVVDIRKDYKDFNLKIEFQASKETMGILGASGSGKSMTLRSIAGIVSPDQGRIVLNGRTLFDSEKGINLPVQERRVGLLFQNYALFPNLTVKENIAFGIRKLPSRERLCRLGEKMASMQIGHLQDKYPYQLSGGEQQRTALARTLVTEPECILLDEPFSALDNHIRAQLEKELLDVFASFKGVTLFVTHNLEECYRVSKNILVMDEGKALSCGCRDEIFLNPPNVKTARLTGCKNISAIGRINADTVKAEEWSCNLEVDEQKIADSTHLGIREHHLTLVDDGKLPNTFPCRLSRVVETPFSVTCFLKMEGRGGMNQDYELQMEVSKEDFAVVRGRPFPWYVQIKPEHIFFMKE
ncbi:MAG: ABC transporter [Gracilibacter sp. BRH_c7a]|nr:MAG: ABC transporter [Gracilibacter sp. BRH_c7a]